MHKTIELQSRSRLRLLVPALVALAPLAASGCGGSGGGSSGGHASTTAPTTSGGTTAPGTSPGSTTPGPIDYTGVWEIAGVDTNRGAYSGTVTVAAATSGFTVQRLVNYATPATNGRKVASAWNATAAQVSGGLQLHTQLRRANVVQRLGKQIRLQNDSTPLAIDALLAPPGGAAVTTTGAGAQFEVAFPEVGLTEKWIRSGVGASLFPQTDVTVVPLHAPPTASEHAMFFNFFAKYQTLPYVAPYTTRADFKGAVHTIPVDHSCRDFYRTNGSGTVVVLDGVVDDISIAEETWRADAFGHLLHEKAAGFDLDMQTNHLDPTGMIMDIYPGSTPLLQPSGDGALHTGCYVASQVYRYQATGDAQALANVVASTQALVTLVNITTDKTTFARAVQTTTTAPSGWTQGAGAYSGLAYLPGGNNDMLHGIEYGFMTAEQILPAGHPLRAQIGAAALSLVNNVSIAQSGTHEIFLLSSAWRTTNDPAVLSRYTSALQGDLKDKIWMKAGNGIFDIQGIADWSGHHLATVTFCGQRILGGKTPTADEQTWIDVGKTGANVAFGNIRPAREGLLASIAGAFGVAGGGDDVKDILSEIPFPKPTGDADIERAVSDAYSVSPYPSDPWKNDWMSNPGRCQALSGCPMFYRGGDENYWARGCLLTGGSVSSEIPTSQDFLHAYWLGRAAGIIGATD